MSAPKLKPCPFCGGEPYLHGFSINHLVMCKRCGAQSDDGSQERTIAAWNRRDPAVLAELPEVQAMVAAARNDALREAMRALNRHGYLSQIRIDTLDEAVSRIAALIQEAP